MTSFKRFCTSKLPRRRLLSSTCLAVGMLALAATAPLGAASAAGAQPWITTWAATPAPRWAEELPAPFNVPEVLGDQTGVGVPGGDAVVNRCVSTDVRVQPEGVFFQTTVIDRSDRTGADRAEPDSNPSVAADDRVLHGQSPSRGEQYAVARG